MIRQQKFNVAFRSILQEENFSVNALVRIMGLSGVCIKKLELSVIESLIS